MPDSKKRPKQPPATPKFPSEQRRCRYCKLAFRTKPTYNGSRMKFCCEKHRKAFDKEGETPIEVIMRKQERRMRQIAREEIAKARMPTAAITGTRQDDTIPWGLPTKLGA